MGEPVRADAYKNLSRSLLLTFLRSNSALACVQVYGRRHTAGFCRAQFRENPARLGFDSLGTFRLGSLFLTTFTEAQVWSLPMHLDSSCVVVFCSRLHVRFYCTLDTVQLDFLPAPCRKVLHFAGAIRANASTIDL